MKRIIFVLALVGGIVVANAQSQFTFLYLEDRLDESKIDDLSVRNHFLGEDVARKVELFKDNYVAIIPSQNPTSPGSTTEISKPAIYSSVKKLEKYYKKALKKGMMSEEVARDEFLKIIDTAIIVKNQGTEDLEALLKQTKEEKALVTIFTESVSFEYY